MDSQQLLDGLGKRDESSMEAAVVAAACAMLPMIVAASKLQAWCMAMYLHMPAEQFADPGARSWWQGALRCVREIDATFAGFNDEPMPFAWREMLRESNIDPDAVDWLGVDEEARLEADE